MPNKYKIVKRKSDKLGWDLLSISGELLASNPYDIYFDTEGEVIEAIRKVKKAGGSYTKIEGLNERNNIR